MAEAAQSKGKALVFSKEGVDLVSKDHIAPSIRQVHIHLSNLMECEGHKPVPKTTCLEGSLKDNDGEVVKVQKEITVSLPCHSCLAS